MMKNFFMLMVSLFAVVGCWFGGVEYPHLAKWMNDSQEEKPFMFTEVIGTMTILGMGYTVKSDACSGDYTVNGTNAFSFYAKLSDGKWVVHSSRELMEDMSKSDAERAFIMTMESLMQQCEAEHKRRQSWNDKSSA